MLVYYHVCRYDLFLFAKMMKLLLHEVSSRALKEKLFKSIEKSMLFMLKRLLVIRQTNKPSMLVSMLQM